MFAAKSVANVRWGTQYSQESRNESREWTNSGSDLSLVHKIALPVETNPEAQIDAAVTWASGQISLTLSGGAEPLGANFADVSWTVTATLDDSIQVLNMGTIAKMQVKMELGSAVSGSISSGTNFALELNGERAAAPVQPRTSIEFETHSSDLDGQSFKLVLTDGCSFQRGDAGRLNRSVRITSIALIDSNGNQINDFVYTTKSGVRYNVLGGTYKDLATAKVQGVS